MALQVACQQNDRILEFYSPIYASHPTWGCCPYDRMKNTSKNFGIKHKRISSGGTLRFSKIKCKATKAHQVCPNRKQQAVSGQG